MLAAATSPVEAALLDPVVLWVLEQRRPLGHVLTSAEPALAQLPAARPITGILPYRADDLSMFVPAAVAPPGNNLHLLLPAGGSCWSSCCWSDAPPERPHRQGDEALEVH